jgi:hypothetical protein
MAGSRWNRHLWLALVCFLAANFAQAWAWVLDRRERVEWTGDSAPLPAPGQSAKLDFRPADNWQRYQLQLKVAVAPSAPTTSFDAPDYPPLPCDFELIYSRDQPQVITERVRLQLAASEAGFPIAIFSAPVHEFEPDFHEVEVRNLGCDRGFVFAGGALQMERVSPVMISATFVPLLFSIGLVIVGLIALAAGIVGLRRRPPVSV